MRPLALAAAVVVALVGCSSPAEPDAVATPTPAATASALPGPAETEQPPTRFYAPPGQVHGSIAELRDAGKDDEADLLERTIANQPQAVWIGDWLGTAVEGTTRTAVTAAADQGAIPVFVVYAIPGRDCGLHSAGGVREERYLGFIAEFAAGLDGAAAWVILEPDALPLLGDCDGQGDRVGLLAGAAEILDAAGARVYLDAGHSDWLPADEAAARIERVGTEHLAGFSLNTSNYYTTAEITAFGDQVAAATGLQYVIDTSRNGNGSTGDWCNPRGRALGEPAQLIENGYVDAYLWIKAPGESDGSCNGGPAAGQWWLEVALELARNYEAAA